MGRKGAKLTQEATKVSEGLVHVLSDLGKVYSRKMFGGYGIFESGAMFALVTSEGIIHLKVDQSNRKRFEDIEAEKYGKMPYFEVPQNVLTNEQKLHEWARDSIDIAHSSKAKIDEWGQGVSYISGVNEMLDALSANYTLVLVTNTHHAKLVQDHLRNSGMERYFNYVITSVEHGRRKPSRSIFEHALISSNGLKEAALFVGDSYVLDYQGALAAGIQSLLIDPEKRYDVPNFHRLNGILELPSAILLTNQANAADAPPLHG